MIQHMKLETVPLTPDLAVKFRDMLAMKGERPLSQRRLDFIATLIRAGRFFPPMWATVMYGGQEYRVDGQHTSRVLAEIAEDPESTIAFPVGLEVVVERYSVDALNEMPDVFERFNHPISARTNSDKLWFFLAQHDDLLTCNPTIAARALGGLYHVGRTRDAKKAKEQTDLFPPITVRERGQLLEDPIVREYVLWLNGFEKSKHIGFLANQGIAVSIYETWEKDKDREAAAGFWSFFFNEDHPDPDHETRILVRDLQDAKTSRSRRPINWSRKVRRLFNVFSRSLVAAA